MKLVNGSKRTNRTGIVVLNWNSVHDTLECIHSLKASRKVDLSILIIDNGSELNALTSLRSHIKQMGGHDITDNPKARGGDEAREILLWRQNSNLGFSSGCNLGIEYFNSRGFKYIFLLNNDAEVTPDTLWQLCKASEEEDLALLGALVLDHNKKVLFSGSHWPYILFGVNGPRISILPSRDRQTSYIEGSALMIRQDLAKFALEKRGYWLEPKFFMYCEDVDFGMFAKSNGFKSAVIRNAVVYHGHSKSGGGGGNPLAFYYITRNRLELARKWCNHPFFACFVVYYCVTRMFLLINHLLKARPTVVQSTMLGLIDGLRGTYGKWSRHDQAFAKKRALAARSA